MAWRVVEWWKARRTLGKAREELERQLQQVDREEERFRERLATARIKERFNLPTPHDTNLPVAFFDVRRAGHQLKYKVLEATLTGRTREADHFRAQLSHVVGLQRIMESLRKASDAAERARLDLVASHGEHRGRWEEARDKHAKLLAQNRRDLDEADVRDLAQLKEIISRLDWSREQAKLRKYTRALNLIEGRERDAERLRMSTLEPIEREWSHYEKSLASELSGLHRLKAEFHQRAGDLYARRVLPHLREAA